MERSPALIQALYRVKILACLFYGESLQLCKISSDFEKMSVVAGYPSVLDPSRVLAA